MKPSQRIEFGTVKFAQTKAKAWTARGLCAYIPQTQNTRECAGSLRQYFCTNLGAGETVMASDQAMQAPFRDLCLCSLYLWKETGVTH
eukprot:1091315-Rhodomonas_salina.1